MTASIGGRMSKDTLIIAPGLNGELAPAQR